MAYGRDAADVALTTTFGPGVMRASASGPTRSPRADPVHRVDGRARLGAANNADLYEAVFRAHRLGYQRDTALLLTRDSPPPFFSNLIALDPDATRPQYRAIAGI